MSFLAAISAVFGWVYTLAWSLSFYPQPLLNWRRRSTAGSTVDFPFTNTLGFFAYLLSTYALLFSPTVRDEYAKRNHGHTPAAALNDVIFAGHAFVLCTIVLSQYLLPRLWGFSAGGTLLGGNSPSQAQRHATCAMPSRFMLGLSAGSLVGVGIVVLLVLRDTADAAKDVGQQAMSTVARSSSAAHASGAWAWLDVVYALGYVKLVITLTKYSPQVLANWRNRSTAGWSIVQILLDFVGGVLSIAQLLIDSYLQGDWSGLTGNPVKLLLGNVSMAYDVIFIVQHYVLYPESSGSDEEARKRADREREALLERGRQERID